MANKWLATVGPNPRGQARAIAQAHTTFLSTRPDQLHVCQARSLAPPGPPSICVHGLARIVGASSACA